MDEFYTIRKSYEVYIDGNDLDAKAAQKLKVGDEIKLVRMNDELDSFEILITTPQGKELDMLSYEESIGIAPFLDDGNLVIKNSTVDSVVVKPGKSRAKDRTTVVFTVEYGYIPELLKPVEIDDTLGFVPNYDMVLAMAIYHCLNGNGTLEKVYLNCYQLDCPVYDDSFLDGEIEDGEYNFSCTVLFNENFTKCKVKVKLYNQDIEYETQLPDEMKESALVLVNHQRIFEDLDPVDCEIEV